MKTFLACLGLALCAGLMVSSRASCAAEPGPAGPSLKAVVHRLQRHYQQTSSFEAKFKEQILSSGGVKRDLEGTIKYRRPGRLRWDFAPPQQQTIVADGTTLFVYQPDLSQVIETPLERAFRTSAPAALLLGAGNIERDFAPLAVSTPPGEHLIRLSLKAKADGTEISLGLDPANSNVVTLTLTDQLGNVTKLDFSDIQTNISLDDSLFSFKVPDGVDVVAAPEPR